MSMDFARKYTEGLSRLARAIEEGTDKVGDVADTVVTAGGKVAENTSELLWALARDAEKTDFLKTGPDVDPTASGKAYGEAVRERVTEFIGANKVELQALVDAFVRRPTDDSPLSEDEAAVWSEVVNSLTDDNKEWLKKNTFYTDEYVEGLSEKDATFLRDVLGKVKKDLGL